MWAVSSVPGACPEADVWAVSSVPGACPEAVMSGLLLSANFSCLDDDLTKMDQFGAPSVKRSIK